MNIIYVTLSPIPDLGGKSKVIESETGGLSGSHSVRIICVKPKSAASPLSAKGVQVFYIDSTPIRSAAGKVLRLIRMISFIRKTRKEIPIDVVSAHDLYGALASILSGLRRSSLVTLHSVYSTDRFVMEKRLAEIPTYRSIILKAQFLVDSALEAICYNLVRGIICVSESEQKDAMRKTISKSKIFLVRNAVDTDALIPSPEIRRKVRSELAIEDDEVTFLYAGRMVPKNGPMIIAQAIPKVASRLLNFKFVFVGEGPEKAKCEDFVKHMQLRDKVSFLKAQEIGEILPMADVFVSHVSSLVSGVGLTVLEAMARGLPVIVGRDEVTSAMIECGEEVLCVRKDDPSELAECMVTLANQPFKRETLSARARSKAVSNFSLAARILKIEELFQSI